jgi:hypothetical protein
LLNGRKVRLSKRVPGVLVPQLKLVELANQHYPLIQVGVFAQAWRNQKPSTAIKFQINRIPDQQSLQTTVFFTERRQLTQFGFDRFPFG